MNKRRTLPLYVKKTNQMIFMIKNTLCHSRGAPPFYLECLFLQLHSINFKFSALFNFISTLEMLQNRQTNGEFWCGTWSFFHYFHKQLLHNLFLPRVPKTCLNWICSCLPFSIVKMYSNRRSCKSKIKIVLLFSCYRRIEILLWEVKPDLVGSRVNQ